MKPCRHWSPLLGLLWALVLVPCNLHAAPPPKRAAGIPYRVGEGDLLEVFVFKHPELTRNVTVLPDETIVFPLIGTIDVSGRTAPDIGDEIAKRLEAHILYPSVTVIPVSIHSYRIYVLGEVRNPGEFELNGAVTILQGIAMAGGLTPYARKRAIRVIHRQGDRPVSSFDYEGFVTHLGEKTGDLLILSPGDTVIVP